MDVVSTARDNQVQALLDEYMSGGMTYSQLEHAFWEHNWSTLNLYEMVRGLDSDRKSKGTQVNG